MTAVDDFIANLRQFRGSADSAPMVGDIDLFIAALQFIGGASMTQNTFERSTSPLTSGTLFTYTGGILIRALYGIVRTAIQAQITQTKLSVRNDALAATDLCATADIGGATVGTLFHITNNPAQSLQVHPNGIDTNGNNISLPYGCICTNSGVVTVTYGAASTGVIDWYIVWEPITPGATVT
jgi:hypothetical protein